MSLYPHHLHFDQTCCHARLLLYCSIWKPVNVCCWVVGWCIKKTRTAAVPHGLDDWAVRPVSSGSGTPLGFNSWWADKYLINVWIWPSWSFSSWTCAVPLMDSFMILSILVPSSLLPGVPSWWLKHAFLKYFFFIKVEFLFYLHNQNQLYKKLRPKH